MKTKASSKAKAIPDGFHTVTPQITAEGADKVIGFLKEVFDAEVTERAVDVHIANLRKKLDEAAGAAGFRGGNPVETVWGLGYRWREEVASRVRSSS